MRYVTLVLALLAMMSACSRAKEPVAAQQPQIRQLPPEKFAELLKDNSAFLVNAESAPKGEIPGTDLLLSGGRALDSLKVVRPDLTLPIAVYCESGQRSDSLSILLGRAGYSNICTLRGGYRAWVEQGLPFQLYDRQK